MVNIKSVIFVLIFLLSFIPLNRITIPLSLLLFPIIRVGLMAKVTYILSADILSSYITDFAISYVEREKFVANIYGQIRQLIDIFPFVLLFATLVKEYIYRNTYVNRWCIILFRYSYVLFYVSMLFLGQQTSSFISARTLHMMCFPLTIVVANYMSHSPRTDMLFKVSFLGLGISNLFAFVYTIFKMW